MAFADKEDGLYALHGINDSQSAVRLTYTVTDVTASGTTHGIPLLSGTLTVPADGNTVAGKLDLSSLEDHVLYITWKEENGKCGASHFIAEPQHLDYRAYLDALTACGFAVFEGFETT